MPAAHTHPSEPPRNTTHPKPVRMQKRYGKLYKLRNGILRHGFSHRQMEASCVFVRQIDICPTKTLALRGRGGAFPSHALLLLYTDTDCEKIRNIRLVPGANGGHRQEYK